MKDIIEALELKLLVSIPIIIPNPPLIIDPNTIKSINNEIDLGMTILKQASPKKMTRLNIIDLIIQAIK